MSKSQIKFQMPMCGEPCILILPDGREIEVYGDSEGLHLDRVDGHGLVAGPSPIGDMCLLVSYE